MSNFFLGFEFIAWGLQELNTSCGSHGDVVVALDFLSHSALDSLLTSSCRNKSQIPVRKVLKPLEKKEL
jgi:hypothetical protein